MTKPHDESDMSKPNFDNYDFEIRRIKSEDGGGFSITFPDLPGCRSDGETADEAFANGREAFDAWMSTCISEGRQIPAPGSRGESSPARFVQRVPKYMHAKLVEQARLQGVSLNALVHGFIAEGLSKLEVKGAMESAASEFFEKLTFEKVAFERSQRTWDAVLEIVAPQEEINFASAKAETRIVDFLQPRQRRAN